MQTFRPPRRCFPAGFTLIELLAVISIMILIGTLIGPSVANILRGGVMTRATNDLSGIIETARAEAMAKDTYVWLGFNNGLVTDTSPKKNPLYWQLRVGVVRSLDGTPSLSSSYKSVGNVFRYDNVVMVDKAGLSPSGQAIAKMMKISGTTTEVAGADCLSTKTFTNGGITFSQMVVFTPQGEAIAGKVSINTATPFEDQFMVGLRKTVGAIGATGPNAKPSDSFLPDTKDVDQAAVVFRGGSGQTQTFRP